MRSLGIKAPCICIACTRGRFGWRAAVVGMASYEDFFYTTHRILQKMCDVPAVSEALRGNLQRGIIAVSDYSGAGGAEMGLAFVLKAASRIPLLGGQELKAKIFRACDVLPDCRRILLSHAECCRPLHVQGDMCDRLSPPARDFLVALLQKHQVQFQQDIVEQKGQRKALVKKHGYAFMREATSVLKESGAFSPETYCWACNKFCPAYPSLADVDGKFYIAVAGNTCVPWSQRGKNMNWLHEASIPFLAWILGLLQAEALPVVIVQECTPLFDVDMFREVLNGGQANYSVQTVVFSPEQLGIPVRRTRQYCVCWRQDMLRSILGWTADNLSLYAAAPMQQTGLVFFRAPASLVLQEQRLLSQGARSRLRDFVAEGRRLALPCFLADINQNVAFHGALGVHCPCLCRSSIVWGMDLRGKTGGVDRLLLPYELLGVAGWPVLLPARHELSEVLPGVFRFAVVFHEQGLSGHALTAVCGNAMHVAQVACALAFAIAGLGPLSGGSSS